MQNEFDPINFQIRTKEVYEYHVRKIREDLRNESIYGIKCDSPFNQLCYYHVTSGLPPDIMHDILEGVAPYEIGLVLKHFCKEGFISYDFLNTQIRKWKYGSLDSRNKPVEIDPTTGKLKQNAGRIWCLLRLLPLMIGHKVPRGNFYWDLIMQVKDISEIVFAPQIAKSHVAILHMHIQDNLHLFKELFPESRIKPKQHFMIHYPKHLLQYGPLKSCWCMRFEAKHNYFKRLVQKLLNFINVCSTLSNRHQFLQCFNQSGNGNLFQNEIEVTGTKPYDKGLPLEIRDKLTIMGVLDTSLQCRSVTLNGIRYKEGMYLIDSFIEDDPVFGKILAMFVKDYKLHFALKLFRSTYDIHFRAYNLQEVCEYNVLTSELMIDYYPLTCYILKKKMWIVLKHLAFDPSKYISLS